MKPSIASIVRSMPSTVDIIGATVHVNRACGLEIAVVGLTIQTKSIPTPETSYPWSDIFDEMMFQGFVPAGGVFYRP